MYLPLFFTKGMLLKALKRSSLSLLSLMYVSKRSAYLIQWILSLRRIGSNEDRIETPSMNKKIAMVPSKPRKFLHR